MSEGQVIALILLGMIGMLTGIFGVVNYSDGNYKLGKWLMLVAVVHFAPALVTLWVKAVGG